MSLLATAVLPLTTLDAQLKGVGIRGSNSDLHPLAVTLTEDDGPDQNGPDDLSQMMKVANYAQSQGFNLDFFIVGGLFKQDPQVLPDPQAVSFIGVQDRPLGLLEQFHQMGFFLWDHTFDHRSLNTLLSNEVAPEVRKTKVLLDNIQTELGLSLIRCPGFGCGQREADLVNVEKDLSNQKGPIDADVGGGFFLDDGKTWVGGDWWFYANNYSADEACKYYVRDIIADNSYKHGSIVLLHVRTENMKGLDGSRQFPIDLLKCIDQKLPSEYNFVQLDGVSGLLGNIQMEKPLKWSFEFPSGSGGELVSGHITGIDKSSLCQAKDNNIACITSVNNFLGRKRNSLNQKFGASKIWLSVSDPDWSLKFNSQFWLVDMNSDGKTDLIMSSSQGLVVAYSTGDGFSYPIPLLQTSLNYKGVKFGDVNGDGLMDIVEWTQASVLVRLNNGNGFDSPKIWSTDFPGADGWDRDQYLSTMKVVDINGDGLSDLVFRSGLDVKVSLSNGKSFVASAGWTRRFNDQRAGWWHPVQNRTFSVAKIAGNVGLVGGLFTGGIVFQIADPVNQKFGLYRYIDNQYYAGDPAWHPERFASQVLFADVTGSGSDSVILVKSDGVYVGLIKQY